MAVTVTNTTVEKFNTVTETVKNAATSTTANEKEVFTITPTKPGHRCMLVIGSPGTSTGDLTFSIAAGDMWAGKAVTGTITKKKEFAIELETARVMKNDGTIALTLTPATGEKLLTEHAAYVAFIEHI